MSCLFFSILNVASSKHKVEFDLSTRVYKYTYLKFGNRNEESEQDTINYTVQMVTGSMKIVG